MGRTPWSAVGPLADLLRAGTRVQGDPRRPGGLPHAWGSVTQLTFEYRLLLSKTMVIWRNLIRHNQGKVTL